MDAFKQLARGRIARKQPARNRYASGPLPETSTAADAPVAGNCAGVFPELFADRPWFSSTASGSMREGPSCAVHGRFGAPRVALERIRRGLSPDVFFHMYGRRRPGQTRICLARLGIPTIVLWIGSDDVDLMRRGIRDGDRTGWHWCVAPWLRDELAEVGHHRGHRASNAATGPRSPPALPTSFTVLAYAHASIDGTATASISYSSWRGGAGCPIPRLAVTSTDELPRNVTALGFVNGTHAIMSQTTVYVRPTVARRSFELGA